MLLKETLEEMSRLKSHCSANSILYILFLGHCFWPLFATAILVHWIHAPNPCSQSLHETTETNMRYPKSLTLNPTVASVCILRRAFHPGPVVNSCCVPQRCTSVFAPPLYTIPVLLVVMVGESLWFHCLKRVLISEEED